jgi:ATP-dependent DNA helicase RecG
LRSSFGSREISSLVRLTDSLSEESGIAPSSRRKLASAGVGTVAELLLHLPFRYEDRSAFARIADLQEGRAASVSARVVDSRLVRTRRRGFSILRAVVEDDSGAIRVIWFNRAYLARALVPGRRIVLYGAPEPEKSGLTLKNPEHEFLEEEGEDAVHVGRVVGIYRRLGKLSGKWVRATIASLLDRLDPEFRAATDSRQVLAALKQIHFPVGRDFAGSGAKARRVLAREELLAFTDLVEERRERRRAIPVRPWTWTPETTRKLLGLFPFPLTSAQKKAAAEIGRDLRSGAPMARLLQGDVGSGKTAVALIAALLAAENGAQAALMAPTEILAEQHAETFARWLRGSRYRLALLTGRTPERARRPLRAALKAGEIDLLVGTHTLIEKPVEFHDLGLAIIDEQHRFGVAHRARLFQKGQRPHMLVLSATPIPRSLAWTVFGDLDVSRLDEKPPGRGKLRTYVRGPERRPQVYRFLSERLEAGERAYVVVPAIEGSGEEIAAVEATGRAVAASIPGARIELLHGKLPGERRQAALSAFVSGVSNVLVATTVVEVGIDVPEATVMLVENAERFGLAQLHQLRGRIGRGEKMSHCVLLCSEAASGEARERLAFLEESSDGFAIAEKDLELRGPGDLLGSRQSGIPGFWIADPIADVEELRAARAEISRRRTRKQTSASDLFPRGHAVIETGSEIQEEQQG